jgi:hypothetical protein
MENPTFPLMKSIFFRHSLYKIKKIRFHCVQFSTSTIIF